MLKLKTDDISVGLDFMQGLARLIAAAHSDEFHVERCWLQFKQMRVYIRANQRVIQGHRQKCLTIANVGTEARYQRKGLFTAMIRCIRINTDLPILVEEAHPEFATALMRHGWRVVSATPLAYNLVKYD